MKRGINNRTLKLRTCYDSRLKKYFLNLVWCFQLALMIYAAKRATSDKKELRGTATDRYPGYFIFRATLVN